MGMLVGEPFGNQTWLENPIFVRWILAIFLHGWSCWTKWCSPVINLVYNQPHCPWIYLASIQVQWFRDLIWRVRRWNGMGILPRMKSCTTPSSTAAPSNGMSLKPYGCSRWLEISGDGDGCVWESCCRNLKNAILENSIYVYIRIYIYDESCI